MALVRIVIVNYNSGTYLENCLHSIIDNIPDSMRNSISVIIVDNGSTDGSIDVYLKRDNNIQVQVIKNQVNLGFATACNQGARGSKDDYLLFLNPDTQIFANSIEKPLAFMEKKENGKVGILGVQLVDEKANVLRTCVRFPKLRTFIIKMIGLNKIFTRYNHFMVDWDHNETKDVDQVMGAYFLVRRNVFEQLVGFDERFFVYFEELDFSLRTFQAGWKSKYFTEDQILHMGCGSSKNVKANRLFYYLRSQIIYGYKHFGRFKGTILLVSTVFLESIARLTMATIKMSLQDVKNICLAYGMLLKDHKNIYRVIKTIFGK